MPGGALECGGGGQGPQRRRAGAHPPHARGAFVDLIDMAVGVWVGIEEGTVGHSLQQTHPNPTLHPTFHTYVKQKIGGRAGLFAGGGDARPRHARRAGTYVCNWMGWCVFVLGLLSVYLERTRRHTHPRLHTHNKPKTNSGAGAAAEHGDFDLPDGGHQGHGRPPPLHHVRWPCLCVCWWRGWLMDLLTGTRDGWVGMGGGWFA